ncbi:ubiquinol-cytochrome c reductase iron-sulfur subunit [Idiomarina tyrosinivorans]|uniref:Ubiquinol-cytochrome c reductase iron-sulfur subunit n=1 Tax=Idiomarina tyrosinivorans TaxID=1445662 RepID=A0A432ZQC8_9GAMM|nr:ubiquinol-cytochrome c reductase iron-sulfur subunit [Idiomarina tyrosinivorans]RUO80100.1 ubiquinol-cytochrome c reductase iron-sulfur subunit [Idiomarina tyrosinivorans]
MSNAPVDKGRRRFLTVATSVVGAAGAVGVAVPFIASWNPSARAKNAGAPVEVNISKAEPGQMLRVKWRGQPVWVVRRTDSMLEGLDDHEDRLRDPHSEEPQQPPYAKNRYRSIKKEYLVAVGICTHLGCSPSYVPTEMEEHIEGVHAGFFCPCHGSMYDIAGRVFEGVPAPLNLVVPPHYYEDDETILVGKDKGQA